MRLFILLLVTQFSVFASPKTIAECSLLNTMNYTYNKSKKIYEWKKQHDDGLTKYFLLYNDGKYEIALNYGNGLNFFGEIIQILPNNNNTKNYAFISKDNFTDILLRTIYFNPQDNTFIDSITVFGNGTSTSINTGKCKFFE